MLAFDLGPAQRRGRNDHRRRPGQQDLIAGLQFCIGTQLYVLAAAENALDDRTSADSLLDIVDSLAGGTGHLIGARLKFSVEKIAWLCRSTARQRRLEFYRL